MKIVVVGTGYVGLVTGACFSAEGHCVVGVDIDTVKVRALGEGRIPFFEPGLMVLVQRSLRSGNLRFSTDLASAVNDADVIFLTVGTPSGAEGESDLSALDEVCRVLGSTITPSTLVVTKSTVPVGTTDAIQMRLSEACRARGLEGVVVASNPEFLREGSAVTDFQNPDRVIVGCRDQASTQRLGELYRPFLRDAERFLTMDTRSAEMAKYAANAMLATRISFMNEIADVCERVDADVEAVKATLAWDPRIGRQFLNSGTGFGGSCFPKDLRALTRLSRQNGGMPRLLSAVNAVNEEQKAILVRKVIAQFGEDLSGLTFALWGLAFKPETDDLREAPSLVIAHGLASRGAVLQVYDPQAIPGAMVVLASLGRSIVWSESKEEALVGASALLLATEWQEFLAFDPTNARGRMRLLLVFDGRNCLDRDVWEQAGFQYAGIGRSASSPRSLSPSRATVDPCGVPSTTIPISTNRPTRVGRTLTHGEATHPSGQSHLTVLNLSPRND